jgi:hypothetical protein
VGLFIIQRASVPHTVKKPCSVILGAGRREVQKELVVRFLPPSSALGAVLEYPSIDSVCYPRQGTSFHANLDA